LPLSSSRRVINPVIISCRAKGASVVPIFARMSLIFTGL
jgi:hypothetical protein